ncbi:MAG: 3-isopropylmalate dehydratase small subunit [Methanobacteriota archaeon]|nr:MAG: 3-isopropylmalate dehydratase small subunit [Euryarchaeota archaeon]
MTCDGRVWKFGDDVNTDLIIPGRYLDNYDPSHLASHAMEGLGVNFARSVAEGDIVIAGRNFGCGSSREQAVTALKGCGVSAVVAASFARIFYRNAVNLGLPVYESPEAYRTFDSGDNAKIDHEDNLICSADGSKEAALVPLPTHLKEVLDSGGLLPHIRSKLHHHSDDPDRS